MAVPNLKALVQAVRNSQTWPFRSKADLCAYSHAVIVKLHQADARFGKLKKVPAQNHCADPSGQLGAVDVALFKETGQIVDFISSAGFEPDLTKPEPPNAVTWTVGPVGEYGPEKWFAPASSGPVPPDPPPVPPDPPPTPPSDHEARLRGLEAHALEVSHQIGLLNQQLADLDAEVVKKPLPPASPHTHRIFGFQTGGPE